MYTVLQYGNSPLNSGSLLAQKEIFHFCCQLDLALSLSTYSVYAQFQV